MIFSGSLVKYGIGCLKVESFNGMKSKLSFQAVVVTGALFLNACAVTGGLPARQTDVLSQAGIMSEADIATRYRLDTQWWTAYGDNTLNALIQQGLDNNIELKQAVISVRKALYAANQTGAGLQPTANGSVGASGSRNLDTGAHTQGFSADVGISYEVDLWQKLRRQTDAKVWLYQASMQDQAATRLSLINRISDAYFNIGYLNQAIGLSEKSIKQYQEINRIAQVRYRVGKTASIEAVQSEQSLLSAQNNLITLRKTLSEQEQVLRDLLNLKPNEDFVVPISRFRLPEPIKVDLSVPVSALANRPDLRAAEYRVQSAANSAKAQQAAWYPSITIGTSLGVSSDHARTLFDVPLLGGTVKINLPFLNWQELKWQNQTAQAEWESARLNFEQTLTAALNEVGKYYQQYGLNLSSWDNQRKRLQLAQKNSRYYSVRYRYGKNSLKDWLDALTSEYSQAQTALNAQYSVLKNENQIYQAMAGRYR